MFSKTMIKGDCSNNYLLSHLSRKKYLLVTKRFGQPEVYSEPYETSKMERFGKKMPLASITIHKTPKIIAHSILPLTSQPATQTFNTTY